MFFLLRIPHFVFVINAVSGIASSDTNQIQMIHHAYVRISVLIYHTTFAMKQQNYAGLKISTVSHVLSTIMCTTIKPNFLFSIKCISAYFTGEVSTGFYDKLLNVHDGFSPTTTGCVRDRELGN